MHLTIIPAFLGVDSIHNLAQAITDGVVRGGRYAIVGVAIALILGTTGRFHFAFASTFTLATYVTSVLVQSSGVPWIPAMLVGMLAATILGVFVEGLVYRPIELRAAGDATLPVFVASLGVTILVENAIRLIWTSNSRTLNGINQSSITFLGLRTTRLDITIVAVAIVVAVLLSVMMARTSIGRQIKAVRVNEQMSLAVGIRVRRVVLLVFGIASAIGGIGGVLDGQKFAVLPNMGTQPLLYGMVVAFLAGTQSDPLRVCAAGLIVGVIQSVSTIWVSEQISIVAVFGVLIIFLSYRSMELAFAHYSEPPFRALWRTLVRGGEPPRTVAEGER